MDLLMTQVVNAILLIMLVNLNVNDSFLLGMENGLGLYEVSYHTAMNMCCLKSDHRYISAFPDSLSSCRH